MTPFPELKDCELYLSGGCVRDTLLEVPFNDRDFVIVTKLSFQEVCDLINSMPDSKVYLPKEEFMTIRCRIQGMDIDIVWPRIEGGYSDNRHPDSITIANSLEEDAKRRDFTINAMYMNKDGEILDFLGGREDLINKVLRTCNDPEVTFQDDYLRIFRLIRFAITKDMVMDNATKLSAMRNISKLDKVPFERIQVELNKALLVNPFRTFWWITVFNLWKFIENKGLTFELTSRKR